MRNLIEICEEQVAVYEKRYERMPIYMNKQRLCRAKELLEAAKRAAWRERLQKAKGRWENL